MTVLWSWVVLEMAVVSPSAANVGFIEPGSRWAAVEKAGPGVTRAAKPSGWGAPRHTHVGAVGLEHGRESRHR